MGICHISGPLIIDGLGPIDRLIIDRLGPIDRLIIDRLGPCGCRKLGRGR